MGTIQFGQHIYALRQHKRLSQRALAAQIGIDVSYLCKIETGQIEPPSEAVIHRLAHALDADERVLLSLTGKVPLMLKEALRDNPLLTELVRVLSQRVLPDEVYDELLALAKEGE